MVASNNGQGAKLEQSPIGAIMKALILCETLELVSESAWTEPKDLFWV